MGPEKAREAALAFLLPLVHLVAAASAWALLVDQAIRLERSSALIVVGIALIVASEVAVAAGLEGRHHRFPKWWYAVTLGRVLLLGGFLWVTTVSAAAIDPADYPSGNSNNSTPIRVFLPWFWSMAAWLVFPMWRWLAVGWIPVAVLYGVLWTRFRIGRIAFLVVLPSIWGFLVFKGFYLDTLPFAESEEDLTSQPGVEVAVSRKKLLEGARVAGMQVNHFVGLFPRSLAEDGNGRLLAAYGHTLFREAVDHKQTPYLFRVDPRRHTATPAPLSGRMREIEPHPRGPELFVCSWDRAWIEVIDADDLRETRRLELPHLEHLSYWEPMTTVAPPGRTDLFIANDIAPAVIRVDRTSGDWLGMVDLEPWSPAGSGTWRLLWSASREVLYVGVAFGDTMAVRLDPETLEVERAYASDDFDYPTAMILGPSEQYLYLQQAFSSRVLRIDVDSGEVVKLGKGLRGGRGIEVSADESQVFVTGWLQHQVRRVDVATGESRSVDVGRKPNGIVRVGDALYVSSVTGILKLDPDLAFGTD